MSVVAAGLAIAMLANGGTMLIAPVSWYGFVPGVVDTRPFNQHLIRDVGLSYVAVGLAFLTGQGFAPIGSRSGAARPSGWPRTRRSTSGKWRPASADPTRSLATSPGSPFPHRAACSSARGPGTEALRSMSEGA